MLKKVTGGKKLRNDRAENTQWNPQLGILCISLSLLPCVFLCHLLKYTDTHKHTTAPGEDLKWHLMFVRAFQFLLSNKFFHQHIPLITQHYLIFWRKKKGAGSHGWASSEWKQSQSKGLQHNDWSLRCLCGAAACCLRSSVSEGLALYGVKQRKWPWLLRGWLAALQPSKSTSTNCTYMAGPKNEITKVFSSEVF